MEKEKPYNPYAFFDISTEEKYEQFKKRKYQKYFQKNKKKDTYHTNNRLESFLKIFETNTLEDRKDIEKEIWKECTELEKQVD